MNLQKGGLFSYLGVQSGWRERSEPARAQHDPGLTSLLHEFHGVNTPAFHAGNASLQAQLHGHEKRLIFRLLPKKSGVAREESKTKSKKGRRKPRHWRHCRHC
jgi:hypothetical protein